MRALATWAAYARLMRRQWLDRARVRELQRRKLRRLLAHAYEHVPFYRERFDAAGIAPADVRSLADLSHVPATTLRELLDAGPAATTSRAFAAEELVTRRTTGSTGESFALRFDPHWLAVQRALFLRALRTAGWGWGRRLALVRDDEGRRAPGWFRWTDIPHELPPAGMLERIRREPPDVLYGWVTPLRQLALHARETASAVPGMRSVVSTAEALDGPTRALLEHAFGAEAFELYGSTEMGMVAVECGAHDGLHLSEETAVVERIEAEDGSGGRLVMTNLDLLSMPLIRYRTGDLAEVTERPCACGRTSPRLTCIEGRLVDCVRLRDGRAISPYRITLAIGPIPGLRRYRVVQEGYARFTVEIEDPGGADAGIDAAVARTLTGIVGEDARVEVVRRATLDPPPGRKFRIVESRVPQPGGEPCAS